MNRIKYLIAFSAFSLLVLSLPTIASAQYSRNGGYNNGNYSDMRSTLRDLKNRTKQLQKQIDRELDHSRLDGTRREDRINEKAKEFKNAVNNLDNSYNNRNDNEVRGVMEQASELDRAISRSGLSYNVKGQWSAIRSDLQALGIGYGYPRGNRNNYPRNGGYNKPSWWPF